MKVGDLISLLEQIRDSNGADSEVLVIDHSLEESGGPYWRCLQSADLAFSPRKYRLDSSRSGGQF